MNYKQLKSSDFESIPKGEKINARVLELDRNSLFKAFVFSEKAGTYSCLLPVKDTVAKLPELKGLDIGYEQFNMPGTEMNWYVMMECSKTAYLANFTEILKEILSEIDKGAFDTVKSIQAVISKWRHFLSAPPVDMMAEEDILGLLGELMFLDKLIDKYDGDAVNAWFADRGEEDFIKDGFVVEVKTSLKEKHQHVINGIDQLLTTPGRSKHILSLLLLKSDKQTELNLPGLIGKCALKIADSPEVIDTFFGKLKYRGYDFRDSESYKQYNFGYFRGGYFSVDGSFPKLTSEELKAPLNARISKVRYTIDMEGLPMFDFQQSGINNII